MIRRRLLWISLLTVGFWLLMIPAANAYLDPGAGSYIFQLLVGAFLAVVVSVKVFWRQIWRVVSRRPNSRPSEPPSSEGRT
jgi:hypothetical protein